MPEVQSATDLVKTLIGLSGDDLGRIGRKVYPEENAKLNQQAHRLGANILTQKYGVLPAQGLGIANELYEAARMGKLQGDELGDLGANVRGSIDAMSDNPNSPAGLWRLVKKFSGFMPQ